MNDDQKPLETTSGESMPKDDANAMPPTSGTVVEPSLVEEAPKPEPPKEEEKPKKKRSKKPAIIVLFLAVFFGSLAGLYFYQQSEIDDLRQQISDLTSENTELLTELSNLKKNAVDDQAPDTETPAEPIDVEAAIEAAVKDGNYASLQPLMADSVAVVIAASEFTSPKTPAEAVAELKYLDAATDPWNFDLPAATLSSYRNGDYASYVPLTAVIGQSANNYVVSFQTNTSGKIAVIFMSVDADLLKPAP